MLTIRITEGENKHWSP